MPAFTHEDRQAVLEAINSRDLEAVAGYWTNKDIFACKYILAVLNDKKLLASTEVTRLMRFVVEEWQAKVSKIKPSKKPDLVDGINEITILMGWLDNISEPKVDFSARLALSYLDTLPVTLGQWIRYKQSEEDGQKLEAELMQMACATLRKELTKKMIEELGGEDE